MGSREILMLFFVVGVAVSSAYPGPRPESRPVERQEIRLSALGEVVPDLSVTDEKGKTVELQGLLRARPTVLVLADERTCFEGRGCPLAQLRDVLTYLGRAGYQVVYVLGAGKEKAARIVREPAGDVFVTLDEAMTIAHAMGVTASNAKDDSAKRSDRARAEVIPTVFVVGTDLRIKYEYVAVSPSVPLSGEVLLTAARVYKDAVVRATPEG